MKHNFKSLTKLLKDRPVVLDLTRDDYVSKYQLIQNGEQSYLVSSPSLKWRKTINVGYYVKKMDLEKYYEGELNGAIVFLDDSAFILHCLSGPTIYANEEGVRYYINGLRLKEEDFKLHPEVIAYKNKTKLKKKLASL